ncbi:hypothetical protein R5R35_007724 [Gryllus longicercus]|uniref:Regulator of microtubule dynamics protein 1 n=1 Tax=Gryllus longicercus TaxID=2509291 RepID=A0AAN9VCG3_9ORTH
MNLAEFLRYRGLLTAAVGAGVMLGAAGIFLYHQLYAERRRMMLQRELARLDITVTEMRSELDSLRKMNCCKHNSSWKKKASSTLSDGDTDLDMHSALDAHSTVDDLEEFFDFSDDEDLLLKYDQEKEDTSPELLEVYEKVDSLLKGDSEERKSALELLQEHYEQCPDNVGLLCRLAKACHSVGTCETEDAKRRREHILQGCAYAQKALELNDSNSEAHKWYAITVGSRGEFTGIREKISDGNIFKQHVDKALAISPNDSALHHLSGRFKYEVASLSWIERTVAKKMNTDFPSATYEEALEDFLKAEELNPVPWKENRLLIAKCYISQDDLSNAIKWLHQAADVPVTLPEDEAAQQEIHSLLAKYTTEAL